MYCQKNWTCWRASARFTYVPNLIKKESASHLNKGMLLNIGRNRKRAEVLATDALTVERTGSAAADVPAPAPRTSTGGGLKRSRVFAPPDTDVIDYRAAPQRRARLPLPEPELPVVEAIPRGGRGGGVRADQGGAATVGGFFRAAEAAFEDRDRERHLLERQRQFAPRWTITRNAFYFMSPEFIREKLAVVKCEHPDYDGPFSVNSPAMGTIDDKRPCKTCNLRSIDCPGHHGYIELAVPLPNPLAIGIIAEVMQCLCSNCGRLLLPPADRKDPQITRLRGPARIRKIAERIATLGNVVCPRNLELAGARIRTDEATERAKVELADERIVAQRECNDAARRELGATDPSIPAMKVVRGALPTPGRMPVENTAAVFGAEFGECPRVRVKYNAPKSTLDWKITMSVSTAKGITIMQPVPIEKIQCIFNSIREDDLRVLGFSGDSHPRNFILRALPVMPERNRAPVERDGEKKQDHLTIGYVQIIRNNTAVSSLLAARGAPANPGAGALIESKRVANESDLSKAIEHLYVMISRFMNNSDGEFKVHKDDPAMTVAARLSGKEGLCRAAAQGKRTNNCGRSVAGCGVTPFGSVMVPGAMRSLTMPERVNVYNIDAIRQKAEAGDIIGITSASGPHMGTRMFYRQLAREALREGRPAPEIKLGDLVYRRAETGDDVIINRQPSLHRHSFIGAAAIFQPWQRTVKIPLHYTPGLNADFDGDELNVSEPQTNRAIAEVRHLMSAPRQIISSQTSVPIMGLVFNCPTAAYILSRDHDDLVTEAGGDGTRARPQFSREEMEEVVSRLLLDRSRVNTLPARLKAAGIPERTPRALLSLVFPETFYYSRRYTINEPEIDPKTGMPVLERDGDDIGLPKKREVSGQILIKNGVFISGILKKVDVTDGIVHELHQRYGGDVAARFLMEGDFILNWYFERRGFSIGLKDCLLADPVSAENAVNTKIRAIRIKIDELNSEPPLTETEVVFRETEKASLLQSVGTVGDRLISGEVTGTRNPLGAMITSGAKGSTNNLAMIVGCLGQQFISGGFPRPILYGKRTMPYFEADDPSIEARGFIRESFGSGMRPASFFYHMAASRLGLLDTAISTASVGDLSRKVSRILENDKIGPYGEVVSSIGTFTSQSYGEGFSLTEMILVKGFVTTGDVYMPFDLKKIVESLNAEDD